MSTDAIAFAVQLLNGVQYGSVLFLVASGLTLTFGVLNVINLAHGVFYMLGAYLAFGLAQATGSFALALAGGAVIAFAAGWLLETVFVRWLYGRDHLAQLLLSFGLILVLDEARQIVFGKDVHTLAPPAWLAGAIDLAGVQAYPVYRLAVCLFCIAVAAAMFLVLHKTRLGTMVRAGAENREMASALGVPTARINKIVFAAGITLAALAGSVVAPISTVYPGMGDQILILAFVIVVLGGIGSVTGAAIGALCVGLIDTFGKVLFPAAASLSVYVLMAAFLIWRPQGLFGRVDT